MSSEHDMGEIMDALFGHAFGVPVPPDGMMSVVSFPPGFQAEFVRSDRNLRYIRACERMLVKPGYSVGWDVDELERSIPAQ